MSSEEVFEKVKAIKNIEILKGEVSELVGINNLEKIILNDNTSLDILGLFISIGGIPNNEFINSLNLDLNQGYIKTNEKMETSEKGVFAVGDIRDKEYYQIATAINDGVIAALSIAEEE